MNKPSQRLSIAGPTGQLELMRDEPVLQPGQAAKGVAVIAHPHPLFGGTMDNKVVQTLARAFVQCGWSAVRFNFRGVGASQGTYDEGRGELADLLSVIEHSAQHAEAAHPSSDPIPIALAGFSFGAFVTSHAVQALWAKRSIAKVVLVGSAAGRFDMATLPPEAHNSTLVIHTELDDTVPLADVLNWARPQGLPVTVVPAGTHFFHGQLGILKNLTVRHLHSF